jgi:hypothetical protein
MQADRLVIGPATPALSLRFPWYHLLKKGKKNVENRSQRFKHRGAFLIHASQGYDSWAVRVRRGTWEYTGEFFSWLKERNLFQFVEKDLDSAEFYSEGGIVGVAKVTGLVEDSNSPWFTGPFGLEVEQAEEINGIVRLPGKLNFFQVPPEIIAKVENSRCN